MPNQADFAIQKDRAAWEADEAAIIASFRPTPQAWEEPIRDYPEPLVRRVERPHTCGDQEWAPAISRHLGHCPATAIFEVLRIGGSTYTCAAHAGEALMASFAEMDQEQGVDDADPEDPEACPGCGCKPGDGVTATCNHPEGCGEAKVQEAFGLLRPFLNYGTIGEEQAIFGILNLAAGILPA